MQLMSLCYISVKDVYIITSMTIVIMVCVWHAIVPAIYFKLGSSVADMCDIVVAGALGTAYVIAHILFAFVIATRVSVICITVLIAHGNALTEDKLQRE